MIVSAPPLTQTPLPQPAVANLAYFEKAWPVSIILGTFFVVTLPIAAITLFSDDHLVTWLYIWLFGITHFVVTLTIYLNSENLRYFASSWRTAVTFFAVPVLIFVTFDLIHAFRLSTTWPLVALVFFGAVRLFDFFHLNRQTFGVLQMFKGRTKAKYPAALRSAENRYLLSFVALLMTTFLSGGVCPLLQTGGPLSLASLSRLDQAVLITDVRIMQVAWVVSAMITVVLFISVVRGHLAMAELKPQKHGIGAALAYVIFQSLGTAMAAFYFPLYLAALAIHYVEYHILMVPRALHSPIDEANRLDRGYRWLSTRPVLLYAGILAVSALVAGGAFVGMNAAMGAPITDFSSPISYLMLIAIFDGIFVFHYFVEMYIWKFSDPHFRRMMAGLYFTPAPKPV